METAPVVLALQEGKLAEAQRQQAMTRPAAYSQEVAAAELVDVARSGVPDRMAREPGAETVVAARVAAAACLTWIAELERFGPGTGSRAYHAHN